nr:hypothetical protein CFP56_78149 [Quercus suber]
MRISVLRRRDARTMSSVLPSSNLRSSDLQPSLLIILEARIFSHRCCNQQVSLEVAGFFLGFRGGGWSVMEVEIGVAVEIDLAVGKMGFCHEE